jgi:signal peptidase I
VSVALPELPDDRRAQPPRHGRSDASGWVQPGVPGPPGVPERPVRLPSTPWPVGGVDDGTVPAPPPANGHARPRNGHGERPIPTNGRDIARFAVPDGPPPDAWGGSQQSGRHPLPPVDAPPAARPQHSGRHPLPPVDAVSRPQHSGRHPLHPADGTARHIHSDVPPPRAGARPHTWTGAQPADDGTAWLGSGPPEPVEEPTVPTGFARAAEPVAEEADDAPAGFPGRHRRRAGESPDERPAASYREQSGRKSRGGKRRRSTFWKELPILVVVALVLTFLIQTFIAKVYVIPSGSMETTLHGCTGCQNDRVLVDKMTYRFSDPAPGDVIVFRGPDGWTSEFTADPPSNVVVRALQGLGSLIGLAPPDEKDFIKRVIAVGGQTVQCCDSRNRVLVDGKALDEPYIYFLPEAGTARQDAFGPITVPAGTLWMMGDSRNNSADSRVPGHGPVPISNVIGRARFIVLPFARIGSIPSPNPQTVAALGDGDAGAPVALGMIGLLPLVVLRRRERELGEFLPRRRT